MGSTQIGPHVRRRNITLSVAAPATRMLKALVADAIEQGKKTPEGRLFDEVIQERYFDILTARLRAHLPNLGVSVGEKITWSSAERYVEVDEIDSDSIRFALIEYSRLRSLRIDLPMSIEFIVAKLVAFFREGITFAPDSLIARVFPEHQPNEFSMEVQLVFFSPGEAPAIVNSVGDARKPEPTRDSYVMVRNPEGETLHGHVTNVNVTPGGTMVITVDRSQLEVFEA